MPKRDSQGKYAKGNYQYEKLMREHPSVEEWLQDRPEGTRIQYGSRVHKFCVAMNVTPEEFQQLDKFGARDLVWSYVGKFKGKTPREAQVTIAALKSFYRAHDGVTLPFDSRRGGKHFIRAPKKKAKYEIIPEKPQVYALVDATTSLRDRALLLTLFESGMRVNAACSLNVGHVRDQLFPEPRVPLVVKITDDLDTKLRGAAIPFYYTALQGEAVEALRNYMAKRHRESDDDAPLFVTRRKTRLSPKQVWTMVKEAARRAGLDARGIWTHSLRKAFRKVVRRASIDDEHKEQLMGHALEGSREAYFDRHAVEEIMEQYMRCDFTRELPQNNHTIMKKQIQGLQSEIAVLKAQRLSAETPGFQKALDELDKDQLVQLAATFQKMIQDALNKK